MGNRLLILGASGMLGQALVAEGRLGGWETIGVARRSHQAVDRQVDVLDDAALASLVRETRPDVLINAAAQVNLTACESDPGGAYRINARLPALLARLADDQGFYLVQISTDHYYTGDGAVLHAEGAPVRLVNEYARSKYASEAFALTNAQALVLRTNLVGFRGDPGQPTFVEWALDSLLRQQPMTLFSDYYTSSTHARTFANLLLGILPARPSGLYNLAAAEVSSKYQFVMALAHAAGVSVGACIEGSVSHLEGAPRAESLGLDVGRMEALLGSSLPRLSDTIASLMIEYEERK